METQHTDRGGEAAARCAGPPRRRTTLLWAVALCLGLVGAAAVHRTGVGAAAGDASEAHARGLLVADEGAARHGARPTEEAGLDAIRERTARQGALEKQVWWPFGAEAGVPAPRVFEPIGSRPGASMVRTTGSPDLAPASRLHPAQGTETATPTTPASTASPTEAPSPSPSPTSYRVADVGVDLTCDPGRAPPGGVYRYVAHTYNRGPALAPNGALVVQLDPGAAARFTAVFTSTTWACHLESAQRARCQAPVVHGSVELEAAVDAGAVGGVARACAVVGFVSPGGGEDPDPANNNSCADVAIDAPTGRRLFLPYLQLDTRATSPAP